ncbi:unnamed protein product [Discosporangium mesarthrocarpum]
MEITKENFELTFEAMVNAIEDAVFIAVDCEFSDISRPDIKSVLPSLLVPPRSRPRQDRYVELRKSASEFMLMQYGLCCFRWSEDGRLQSRPFNISVFPSTDYDRVIGGVENFSCQTSSMAFLR